MGVQGYHGLRQRLYIPQKGQLSLQVASGMSLHAVSDGDRWKGRLTLYYWENKRFSNAAVRDCCGFTAEINYALCDGIKLFGKMGLDARPRSRAASTGKNALFYQLGFRCQVNGNRVPSRSLSGICIQPAHLYAKPGQLFHPSHVERAASVELCPDRPNPPISELSTRAHSAEQTDQKTLTIRDNFCIERLVDGEVGMLRAYCREQALTPPVPELGGHSHQRPPLAANELDHNAESKLGTGSWNQLTLTGSDQKAAVKLCQPEQRLGVGSVKLPEECLLPLPDSATAIEERCAVLKAFEERVQSEQRALIRQKELRNDFIEGTDWKRCKLSEFTQEEAITLCEGERAVKEAEQQRLELKRRSLNAESEEHIALSRDILRARLEALHFQQVAMLHRIAFGQHPLTQCEFSSLNFTGMDRNVVIELCRIEQKIKQIQVDWFTLNEVKVGVEGEKATKNRQMLYKAKRQQLECQLLVTLNAGTSQCEPLNLQGLDALDLNTLPRPLRLEVYKLQSLRYTAICDLRELEAIPLVALSASHTENRLAFFETKKKQIYFQKVAFLHSLALGEQLLELEEVTSNQVSLLSPSVAAEFYQLNCLSHSVNCDLLRLQRSCSTNSGEKNLEISRRLFKEYQEQLRFQQLFTLNEQLCGGEKALVSFEWNKLSSKQLKRPLAAALFQIEYVKWGAECEWLDVEVNSLTEHTEEHRNNRRSWCEAKQKSLWFQQLARLNEQLKETPLKKGVAWKSLPGLKEIRWSDQALSTLSRMVVAELCQCEWERYQVEGQRLALGREGRELQREEAVEYQRALIQAKQKSIKFQQLELINKASSEGRATTSLIWDKLDSALLSSAALVKCRELECQWQALEFTKLQLEQRALVAQGKDDLKLRIDLLTVQGQRLLFQQLCLLDRALPEGLGLNAINWKRLTSRAIGREVTLELCQLEQQAAAVESQRLDLEGQGLPIDKPEYTKNRINFCAAKERDFIYQQLSLIQSKAFGKQDSLEQVDWTQLESSELGQETSIRLCEFQVESKNWEYKKLEWKREELTLRQDRTANRHALFVVQQQSLLYQQLALLQKKAFGQYPLQVKGYDWKEPDAESLGNEGCFLYVALRSKYLASVLEKLDLEKDSLSVKSPAYLKNRQEFSLTKQRLLFQKMLSLVNRSTDCKAARLSFNLEQLDAAALGPEATVELCQLQAELHRTESGWLQEELGGLSLGTVAYLNNRKAFFNAEQLRSTYAQLAIIHKKAFGKNQLTALDWSVLDIDLLGQEASVALCTSRRDDFQRTCEALALEKTLLDRKKKDDFENRKAFYEAKKSYLQFQGLAIIHHEAFGKNALTKLELMPLTIEMVGLNTANILCQLQSEYYETECEWRALEKTLLDRNKQDDFENRKAFYAAKKKGLYYQEAVIVNEKLLGNSLLEKLAWKSLDVKAVGKENAIKLCKLQRDGYQLECDRLDREKKLLDRDKQDASENRKAFYEAKKGYISFQALVLVHTQAFGKNKLTTFDLEPLTVEVLGLKNAITLCKLQADYYEAECQGFDCESDSGNFTDANCIQTRKSFYDIMQLQLRYKQLACIFENRRELSFAFMDVFSLECAEENVRRWCTFIEAQPQLNHKDWSELLNLLAEMNAVQSHWLEEERLFLEEGSKAYCVNRTHFFTVRANSVLAQQISLIHKRNCNQSSLQSIDFNRLDARKLGPEASIELCMLQQTLNTYRREAAEIKLREFQLLSTDKLSANYRQAHTENAIEVAGYQADQLLFKQLFLLHTKQPGCQHGFTEVSWSSIDLGALGDKTKNQLSLLEKERQRLLVLIESLRDALPSG